MNENTNSRVRDIPIGVLSTAAGVNIETIRYYERIGILPKPPRTEGGHRIYDDEHVKRLVFVRRARELGFTLAQVRTLLDMTAGGGDSCEKVKALTLGHLDDVERKIADLERLREVLSDHAARCQGERAPACPLLDTLFAP